MIQQFVHIVLISLICIAWGLPLMIISRKHTLKTALTAEEIILSFFAGISLLSVFAAWACIWWPLSWKYLAIATAFAGVLVFLLYRNNRFRLPSFKFQPLSTKNKLPLSLLGIAGIFLFIVLSGNRPVMIDTDLYHLQIIRWNKEYGTVPGLANLYLRYGFYSNWLSLISLFSFPFRSENYLAPNAALSCWMLLFLLQKLSVYLSTPGNKLMSWIYVILILLMFGEWGLLRVNASSTSYDFIVSCFTLILLLQFAATLMNDEKPPLRELLPYLFIGASVPFFKLSGAAIILVILVFLFVTRSRTRTFGAFAALLIVFAVPYLYRNYLQTGFPFFPYSFASFSKPDWQVPPQMTQRLSGFISLLNKYFNQPIPASEWQHPTFRWVQTWYPHVPHTSQLIIGLAAAGIPLYLLYGKNNRVKIRGLYITCWLCVAAWFLLSPDPRFAYGYLLFIASIPLSFLASTFLPSKLIPVSLLVVILCIIVYGGRKFNAQNFVTPEISGNAASDPEVTILGSNYHIPVAIPDSSGMRCYDHGIPCIYEINPYLERRGKTLADGFRMKVPVDSAFMINYGY